MAAPGVEQTRGNNDQPMVVLRHLNGASSEVYLYGATVTSYKTAEDHEVLYLSPNAIFNGVKAIRGGIPLVFPQFGAGALPQHGFARNSVWEFVGGGVQENGSTLAQFALSSSAATMEVWPHPFTLLYSVSLTEAGLTTELRITNTGSESFDFQTLFHPYFRHSDIEGLRVIGLKGCEFSNKLRDGEKKIDEREQIPFESETDTVYASTPPSVRIETTQLTVEVAKHCRVQEQGGEEGSPQPTDTVVWNPWVEKARSMGDFPDEDFRSMVCVEPGAVEGTTALAPQASFTLSMTIASQLKK